VEKVETGGPLGQVLLFGEGVTRGGRRGVDLADDPLIALNSQHRAVDLEGRQGQLAGTRYIQQQYVERYQDYWTSVWRI